MHNKEENLFLHGWMEPTKPFKCFELIKLSIEKIQNALFSFFIQKYYVFFFRF